MRKKTNIRIFIKPVIVFLLTINLQLVYAQADTASRLKSTAGRELFLSKFEAYQTSKNISGLVAVAEQNHYPSTHKVLLWQKELNLNDRQKAALTLIDKELTRKLNEMNNFLITNERTIDSLFKYKKMNNGTLIFYTNRYGLYQGELRNALLQACVKTEAILTSTQIKKYDALLPR